MQTRKKSFSLSELGISVPRRKRTLESDDAPAKKSKLSHGSASPPSGLMSPPKQTASIRIKDEKPKRATELSPPPSPATEGNNKIDVEGINDEIVVQAIQQLEKTGNRPHLVKELAHVLSTSLPCIEKSANPSALISSRLTAYLQRPWPAISPCPLAKDLSPVHPRRLYFYLTTMPHQPLPDVAEPLLKPNRIISPSLSSASAADEEDERYARSRAQMSPSPEVDLSSPELEDETQEHPEAPGGRFSGRNSIARESRASSMSHPRRAASPQLEREERDFKQTASQLYEQAQLRRNSSSKDVNMDQADTKPGADADTASIAMSIEDTEDSVALNDSNDAAALFGSVEHLQLTSSSATHLMDFRSPVIEPQQQSKHGLKLETFSLSSPIKQEEGTTRDRGDEVGNDSIMAASHSHPNSDLISNKTVPATDDFVLPDAAFGWDDTLQSPENIDVTELDDMFDAY
ncbi:hypothetical protein KC318_g3845 [Hortaea werneckii]|uniref:GDS1 winged helix domain-containing protein n=2 Tax=Hortaea werneckii TaxID=91943 RepID=A0A3M6ZD80_HORWE|nr:hypothetical protein KC334_g4219 [Hortaea werneckii]KAI7015801.1 hypothetical protein KC355_g4218 [Hortaea werneckii]KAI7670794.1 hypothetical protein KC318_g3845 [Hortaea werneckii]RMY13256.1 hypothetical protein D0867_07513 [Hortaea werneckii]